MHVTLHHPEDLEQLRQYSRKQHNAKQRDRYRAVVLALEGHEAPEIAGILDRSRRFVQRWVYHYRSRHRRALSETANGRPSKLPPPQYEAFKTRFLAEPTAADAVYAAGPRGAQILAQSLASHIRWGHL
jgi:transposase